MRTGIAIFEAGDLTLVKAQINKWVAEHREWEIINASTSVGGIGGDSIIDFRGSPLRSRSWSEWRYVATIVYRY